MERKPMTDQEFKQYGLDVDAYREKIRVAHAKLDVIEADLQTCKALWADYLDKWGPVKDSRPTTD
jgi:hypothetical protein